MIMRKQGVPHGLSVPDHRELGRGTLRRLISSAGLTVADFRALLD
jgi:hypothetical protein